MRLPKHLLVLITDFQWARGTLWPGEDVKDVGAVSLDSLSAM